MPRKSVFCIASSLRQVNQIVDCLRAEGFFSDDISAVLPERIESRDCQPKPGNMVHAGRAVRGARLGPLTDIRTLALPGVGDCVTAGPITAALNDPNLDGVIESVADALTSMGVAEPDASAYEDRLRKGGILLSVHTEDSEEIKRAWEIFEQARAHDIAAACGSRATSARHEMATSDYTTP